MPYVITEFDGFEDGKRTLMMKALNAVTSRLGVMENLSIVLQIQEKNKDFWMEEAEDWG